MSKYLLQRLLQAAGVLLVLSFLVYLLIGLMPGDPVDLMAAGNPKMTAEDVARLRQLYGLDQPLLARYGRWLASALQGDFGYSRLYSQPVFAVLLPALARSLQMLGLALVLTVALAVPAGVLCAVRPASFSARALQLFSLAGISMPSFWAGLLLIGIFAVKLGWLPASAQPDSLRSLILPVLVLVFAGLASYLRHTRAVMTEALQADHIRTAQAKGCGKMRVLWRHAFTTALPPLVTLLMLDLGTLIGGALTVETVFAWPGMGKLLFDAVMGNDYNLALAGFLLLAACILAASLLADIIQAALDPRVVVS